MEDAAARADHCILRPEGIAMNGEIHRASSVAQQAPYVSKMTRKLVLYSYCTVAVRRSVHRPRAETAESVMMSLTRMELCKFRTILSCPVCPTVPSDKPQTTAVATDNKG